MVATTDFFGAEGTSAAEIKLTKMLFAPWGPALLSGRQKSDYHILLFLFPCFALVFPAYIRESVLERRCVPAEKAFLSLRFGTFT